MVHLSDTIISITPDANTVTVTPEEKIVNVASSGPPGPQGPIGPAGGDVFVYDRNGTPAQQWVITHNLNRLVHVTVVLDSGEEVTTDVDQFSLNALNITFGIPTSGKALVG